MVLFVFFFFSSCFLFVFVISCGLPFIHALANNANFHARFSLMTGGLIVFVFVYARRRRPPGQVKSGALIKSVRAKHQQPPTPTPPATTLAKKTKYNNKL